MAVARGGSRLLGEACTTGYPYPVLTGDRYVGDAAVATCVVKKFKFKFSVEESGTVPC